MKGSSVESDHNKLDQNSSHHLPLSSAAESILFHAGGMETFH